MAEPSMKATPGPTMVRENRIPVGHESREGSAWRRDLGDTGASGWHQALLHPAHSPGSFPVSRSNIPKLPIFLSTWNSLWLRPFLTLSLLEGLQYSLGISNPGNTNFYEVKEIKVISELSSVNY